MAGVEGSRFAEAAQAACHDIEAVGVIIAAMERRHVLALLAIASLPLRQARAADDAPPVLTRVTTPLGAFVVAVDPKVAPITVANYLAYVDAGHLDGGSVYRIVTPANQPADTPTGSRSSSGA